jgi:Bacteriocin-protection, YdeI or OmpD-Associated
MAANAKISSGTVHALPADLRKALLADAAARAKWEDITPLARNEWICWTTFVKQDATRADHVRRVVSELKEGMRRPCCWIGCIHRADKKISRSVQYVLANRSGSKSRPKSKSR